MGFKDLIDKTKKKLNETIEKSNMSIKKFQNTKLVTIYSKPVFGGFDTKRAFFEENKLLFPIEDFDDDLIQENTIIGLDEDQEYYVIQKIDKTIVQKIVQLEKDSFCYECYEVTYMILNDASTDDVDGLPFYELTVQQEELLNEIRKKIESYNLAMKSKKEFCLHLWELFVECIEYRKKDHYIVIAFSRIATEYVDDYATYLIKLFA